MTKGYLGSPFREHLRPHPPQKKKKKPKGKKMKTLGQHLKKKFGTAFFRRHLEPLFIYTYYIAKHKVSN